MPINADVAIGAAANHGFHIASLHAVNENVRSHRLRPISLTFFNIIGSTILRRCLQRLAVN